MNALEVVRVEVASQRIEALVRVPDGAARTTFGYPGIAQRVLAHAPGLSRHRCDNGAHRSFAHELPDTELSHLLEHLTIELMALAGSPRSLAGDTQWDFARDGAGTYRVRFGYDDDLVALAALTEATEAVNALCAGEGWDAAAAIDRVRAHRHLP